MNHLSRALFAVLFVALLPRPAAAQCTEGGGQLQVLVKAKTAIRRGPGLNYPVSAFVEGVRIGGWICDACCRPFSRRTPETLPAFW